MLARVNRAARSDFVRASLKEIGLQSGRKLHLSAASELYNPRPAPMMSAIFEPSSKTVNMAEIGSHDLLRSNQYRRKTLTVKTHGSKVFPSGFVLNGKRGQKLMDRGPEGLHALRTTKTSTLMGQEDSHLPEVWKRTAERELDSQLPAAVERAIEKAGLR